MYIWKWREEENCREYLSLQRNGDGKEKRRKAAAAQRKRLTMTILWRGIQSVFQWLYRTKLNEAYASAVNVASYCLLWLCLYNAMKSLVIILKENTMTFSMKLAVNTGLKKEKVKEKRKIKRKKKKKIEETVPWRGESEINDKMWNAGWQACLTAKGGKLVQRRKARGKATEETWHWNSGCRWRQLQKENATSWH